MHKIIKELQLMDKGHTAREIASQPGLWQETYETVLARKDEIKKFLDSVCQQKDLQIILTGAGSSAFIGEILQYSFHRNTGRPIRAVPTTDLVTHPGDFFRSAIPTLLVSFARSGDSPESIASYELAENMIDKVFHLVITCNPEGKLATKASAAGNAFFLLLPEGTNDQALAMTSSFTSMTLAGLLVAEIDRIEDNRGHVKGLAAAAAGILDKYSVALQGVADLDFQRIVFLGSGPLKGSAQEAHLKVIELTDGKINCQYDSFLGFRHGPKAIIDASTLLVYLFSNDPHVTQYERDLVASINETEEFLYSIGIRQTGPLSGHLDLEIIPDPAGTLIPDDFLAICSVIPAQLLGLYKSLALGLTPDAPSRNGGIHRVVQGVTIYPYPAKNDQ